MEKFETYILLLGSMSDGRKALEKIENEKFDGVGEVFNALCFDENDPMATEDLQVIPITEFMDWMNNQDDDMPEDERFNPMKYWFGYVQVKSL